MKGRKPELGNVVPMKGDAHRSIPEPPDLLGEGAKEIWNKLAARLVSNGHLEPEFEIAFSSYCTFAAKFFELASNVEMNGVTYATTTRNGTQQKKSADWQALQDAATQMQRLGAMFGFTPVDAKRLGAADQGDLFEDLMREINGTN